MFIHTEDIHSCRWLERVAIYAAAAIATLVPLAWVVRLWRCKFNVPFAFSGDALFFETMIKGVVQNGWYSPNPSLGAPFGLNLADFPISENTSFLIVKLLSLVISNPIAVANVYCLLGYPLVALCGLAVFRQLGMTNATAVALSALYALLPYHLARQMHHIFFASYFLVPLAILMVIKVQDGSLDLPSGAKVSLRLLAPWLVLCVLLSSSPYYAFFTGFLLVVAGLFALLTRRSWRGFLAAVALTGMLFAGLLANLAPALAYRFVHGDNVEVARRVPAESEIYGLKIAQMVLPVSGHRIPALAKLREEYRKAPLTNENDTAALGIVGAVGFLFLLGRFLFSLGRGRGAGEALDRLAFLNAAAVLLGTIGGFGSLFAHLISPIFRGYNRISIFIGFLALAAVGLLLDRLIGAKTNAPSRRIVAIAAAVLLLCLGVFDQTTRAAVPPYDQLASQYTTVGDFVRRVESTLPPGAMVFQLPYVPFPESPPVNRMTDYDHFRPAVLSQNLRWSYGAMRGRPGDAWQHSLSGLPADGLARGLALAGFTGLCVDRFGYADGGARIESALAAVFGPAAFSDNQGRLAFYDLRAFVEKARKETPTAVWEQKREEALFPLVTSWGRGFFGQEGTSETSWRWCGVRGDMMLENPRSRPVRARITMQVSTGRREQSRFALRGDLLSETMAVESTGVTIDRVITIPHGRHVVRMECNAPPVDAPQDPRTMVFRIINYSLQEVGGDD